jgi:hypothetical protein
MDLRITFSGSEETLTDIKSRLDSSSADTCGLCDALALIVQQTLVAAGVNSEFSVAVQSGQIRLDFGKGGGLNANEWMDRS